MTEQSGPKSLVNYAVSAEAVGFDFEVSSDHYSPWLSAQGHAPYAWAVLGAVAQATERVEIATYVTCPTMRYHPAVIAQKAATLQQLSDGRFILGLGAGENLNEHVIGQGWPPVAQRQDMLEEAIEIIRALHTGELTTWEGAHFRVDSARVWDAPEAGVPIAVAVSSAAGAERFGALADHLITTEPEPSILDAWPSAAARRIGQVPICWGPDKAEAVATAHEQFRWFAGGWSVNADLPTPHAFEGASKFVRPEDVESQIACGPDLEQLADSIRTYASAGFTDVALVQVGDANQQQFLDEVAGDLLALLRE
ncbi:MAG: class F420-dependent oxidoreductase [Microbacteriaceae bacterium]|nr:class F420-dependent oxidoreductase [Microbacteriaceae bacterium]